MAAIKTRAMVTKFYLFSKKIHRLLVFVVIVLGLFMMASGLMLKYTAFVIDNLKFIDLIMIRYLHNSVSVIFTAVLFVMMLTGVLMYFLPMMIRKKSVAAPAPPTEPPAT